MTTFEKWTAVGQIVANLEGLRKDIRRNAQAYIDAAQGGKYTLAQIQTVIAQDAAEYERRLGWVASIPSATLTELKTFVTAIGMDPTEITGGYSELKAAADYQQNNPPASLPQIVAGANNLLASVSTHFTLW